MQAKRYSRWDPSAVTGTCFINCTHGQDIKSAAFTCTIQHQASREQQFRKGTAKPSPSRSTYETITVFSADRLKPCKAGQKTMLLAPKGRQTLLSRCPEAGGIVTITLDGLAYPPTPHRVTTAAPYGLPPLTSVCTRITRGRATFTRNPTPNGPQTCSRLGRSLLQPRSGQ